MASKVSLAVTVSGPSACAAAQHFRNVHLLRARRRILGSSTCRNQSFLMTKFQTNFCAIFHEVSSPEFSDIAMLSVIQPILTLLPLILKRY